LENGRKFL
jgi:DNA-directed RNA polymerase subunit K/omega